MLLKNGKGQLAEIGEKMQLIENKQYLAVLKRLLSGFPHWDRLEGKQLLISGAAGMIGSLLIDAIMLGNEARPKNRRCEILALGRNQDAARLRFAQWWERPEFYFVKHDITEPLGSLPIQPDYWIHAASTTHPVAYAAEPINTILSNVLGTRNLLEKAASNKGSRFLLLSSVEIYGENRGDTEYFKEDYCGYLDCNTLRAGYPEAKRTSEALCQAYISQKNVDAVILRLPRCYGPSMRMSDTKAIAQFIKKAVNGENIVLKSNGEQRYSFAHAADAVLGMLFVLLCGTTGQAYNLASEQSDVMQKDLAKLIAAYAGTHVVFDIPSEAERRGYSTATKALMAGSKLEKLGWRARYDIRTGIQETISILKSFQTNEI